MRFFADGTERHGASREALDNFFRCLNLFERDRLTGFFDLHQAAQGGQITTLRIDQCGIVFEALKILFSHAVLQLADRLRVQQVVLAIYAKMIAAADRQLSVCVGDCAEREFVLKLRLTGQNIESYPAEMAGLECSHQCRLVDDGAARGVDQERAAFHAQ